MHQEKPSGKHSRIVVTRFFRLIFSLQSAICLRQTFPIEYGKFTGKTVLELDFGKTVHIVNSQEKKVDSWESLGKEFGNKKQTIGNFPASSELLSNFSFQKFTSFNTFSITVFNPFGRVLITVHTEIDSGCRGVYFTLCIFLDETCVPIWMLTFENRCCTLFSTLIFNLTACKNCVRELFLSGNSRLPIGNLFVSYISR